MARRTFDLVDVIGILQHWHVGRSQREMSASLDVDRKTLRKYIAPAAEAGIAPGGRAKSREEWAELVQGWFPALADTRLRRVTWPAIDEHHEFIARQLEAGMRVPTIWQRLRNEHGLAVSLASLRRYVAANVPEASGRTQVRERDHAQDAGERAVDERTIQPVRPVKRPSATSPRHVRPAMPAQYQGGRETTPRRLPLPRLRTWAQSSGSVSSSGRCHGLGSRARM